MAEQPVKDATPMKLVAKFAEHYFLEPDKLLVTLKATAFKQGEKDPVVSNEQMAALLIVADQYKLNPFTREIFAFPDSRRGIVPVVSVDGWARIINEAPTLNGIEFAFDSDDGPVKWCECTIYRKDRDHPTVIREFFSECKRDTSPWGSHPRRMLRHKALIQCARIAFGFAGIYDEDEAARIVESSNGQTIEGTATTLHETKTGAVKEALKQVVGYGDDDKPKPAAAAAPEPVSSAPGPATTGVKPEGITAEEAAIADVMKLVVKAKKTTDAETKKALLEEADDLVRSIKGSDKPYLLGQIAGARQSQDNKKPGQ